MNISIKNLENGKIYSNDMSCDNKLQIVMLSFCSYYTIAELKEEIDSTNNSILKSQKITDHYSCDGKDYIHYHIVLPPIGVSIKDFDYKSIPAVANDTIGDWFKNDD